MFFTCLHMGLFNCLLPQVVLQEVPNEVSLLFSITGCDVGCSGCHSVELWDPNYGQALTISRFTDYLNQYKNYISCVLFFGGEWQENYLIEMLSIAKNKQLKTCLYTGRDDVSLKIKRHLDYLKTGRFQVELGGLASKNSNQQFIDLNRNQIINHKFIK